MAAVSLFFMGQFALFTYVRPFLESVTHVGMTGLTGILLAVGVAGFVGTTCIGAFLDRHLFRTLTAIPLLMALLAAGLVAWGTVAPVAAVLLALWGLVATAAPVGWWTWLARTLPHDAEAGGGLIVAVVQLAIGLGATLGGMLYDAWGYRATFGLGGILLVVAAALAHRSARP
jgi:predicted MFS family arabinose efflux permease